MQIELTQTKTNDFKIFRSYNYGYKRLTIFHKKERFIKSCNEVLKQKVILSNGNVVWLPIEIEIKKQRL